MVGTTESPPSEVYAHEEFVVVESGKGSFRVEMDAVHRDDGMDEYRYTLTNVDYCGGITYFAIDTNGNDAVDRRSSTSWGTSIENGRWCWEGQPALARGQSAEFTIILDGPRDAVFGIANAWAPPPCPAGMALAHFEVLTPSGPGIEETTSEGEGLAISIPCGSVIAPAEVPVARSIDPSGLRWMRLGGPLGGLGYDVRMHPDDPDLLFVTDANAGLHTSTNGGKTWSLVRVDPTRDITSTFSSFCVTIDPNDPNIIWTGLKDVGGLWFSADGGVTWEKRINGFKEESGFTLRGITVEPGNSSVVYVAGEISSWVWAGTARTNADSGFDITQGAVYKSTDQGLRWEEIWRGDNLARYVWIDPRDTDVLYVSTGLFDRDAANSSFETRTPGGVGILKSTDGGASWRILNEENGLTGLYVGSLFMHPEDPDILLAGVGHTRWTRRYPGRNAPAGAYLTEDGGETWTRTLESEFISAVEISTSDPQIAYAAGDHEFYRSEDGGHTWQRVGESTSGYYWGPPGIIAGFPVDIQVDPRDPYRLFVNNYQGGNFLSEDGGETWEDASSGYSGARISGGLAIDPRNSNRVYCAAFSGLFVSEDGGHTWEGLAYEPIREANPTAVAVSPHNPDLVLSAPWDLEGLAVSPDGGRTRYRVIPHGTRVGIQYLDIVFAPSAPGVVYAAAGSRACEGKDRVPTGECDIAKGGVYKSEDCGVTWANVSDRSIDGKSVAALAVHPQDHDTVYAGVLGGGLFFSNDGGDSWNSLPVNLISVRDIAISPSDPATIYAAGYGGLGGVFRSEDGGATWIWASSGLDPQVPIYSIEVDPYDPMIVWLAGGGRGVHLSIDGGRKWVDVRGGEWPTSAITLKLSADGRTLYAGTQESGVFRLDTTGETSPGYSSSATDDRDGDGVPDDQDFCPDFPGSKTTNGC